MSIDPRGAYADIPLFDGVPADALVRHGLRPSPRRLAPGETLLVVGEPRDKIWFLRSGWVVVRTHSPAGHEATTALIGPGEIVGCAAYFGLETYPCTVTALTEVTALGASAPGFERWLESDARAACRMIAVLGGRLRESTTLKAINAERAPVRLRLTLDWLARKFGPEIPATRALLADLTGLRAETCSRVLSTLRRRGVLRVSPGRVSVLRPEALAPR